LFTYTGTLGGQPVLGAAPAGFEGYTFSLATNTAAKQLLFQVTAPSSPSFSSASYVSSSGTLIVSGAGGLAVANGIYNVLTSTNVALPLNQWTPIATNSFDGSGNFIFTNLVSTNVTQQYFLLQIPEP
jgi:hypothetical protein